MIVVLCLVLVWEICGLGVDWLLVICGVLWVCSLDFWDLVLGVCGLCGFSSARLAARGIVVLCCVVSTMGWWYC